eukprot:365999-Chlamydomonas_euryale.AAC.14
MSRPSVTRLPVGARMAEMPAEAWGSRVRAVSSGEARSPSRSHCHRARSSCGSARECTTVCRCW